jgi:hypothetical protein
MVVARVARAAKKAAAADEIHSPWLGRVVDRSDDRCGCDGADLVDAARTDCKQAPDQTVDEEVEECSVRPQATGPVSADPVGSMIACWNGEWVTQQPDGRRDSLARAVHES